MDSSRSSRVATALLLGLLVAAPCALQAWVSDDAFITLRVVDNVLEGRGAVWNEGQRVQAYTHPAWFALLVIVVGVTREFFLTPMALGVALSFAFVAGLMRHARLGRGCFVAALLAASPSFVDFATSGLENPLTHLLLLLGALEARRPHPRVARLVLWAGLLHLTRPDGVLLMAPPLALVLWRAVRADGPRRPARDTLVALLPVLGWYAWALIYYGTPIANTALAKLGAGLPPRHTWPVGLHYLGTLVRDPAALVLVAAASATALRALARKHTESSGAVAFAWWLGMLLHVTYIVSIGGDFMLGRFWTPLIALSAIVLVLHAPADPPPLTTATPHARRGWVLATTASLIVLGAHAAVFALGVHPGQPEPATELVTDYEYGVYDERAFYRGDVSIQAWVEGRGPWTTLSGRRARALAAELRESGQRRVVEGAQAGFFGFYGGPAVHLLDAYALADPLLSRLPAFRMPLFRAGHLPRVVPPGYVVSERVGENRFDDEALGALWERVRLLTRGPLFTRARWEAIAWFMTHQSTDGLDVDRYLLWHATHVAAGQLTRGPVGVRDMGIHVELEGVARAHQVTVTLDPPDRRELWFYRGDTRLAELVAPASNDPVDVPDAARGGFDRVVVLPRDRYLPDARRLLGFALDGRVLPEPAQPSGVSLPHSNTRR